MREKLAKKLAGTLGLIAYRVGELRALGIQGLVVAVGGVDQLGADGALVNQTLGDGFLSRCEARSHAAAHEAGRHSRRTRARRLRKSPSR